VLLILGAFTGLGALLFAPLPWPDFVASARIVTHVDIAAPPQAVFAYATTPANWPAWHPASRAVSGAIDHTPQPGEQVIEEIDVADRRFQTAWTSIAVDSPRRWEFGGQAGGGGRAHIVYTLEPSGTGTRFVRDLTYSGPNLFFALVNAVWIRGVMEADSAEATVRLKRGVEKRAAMP
jgi:uncharacterized protein YndB with AHSA1/START domain